MTTVTDAVVRVHDAFVRADDWPPRSARRLRPRGLGPARRDPADRRRQSARRVALLLRRAQRGTAAGGARFAAALFLSDRASIEAVYVPVFRRGRFDLLDEPTSPFSPAARPGERIAVCLAIGCPTLPPVIVDRRAIGWRGRARREAPASARRPAASTGRRGVRRASSLSLSIRVVPSAPGAPPLIQARIRGSR